MELSVVALLSLSAASLALVGLWKVIVAVWWRPLCIKRSFEAQGITGMPYRLFYGNLPQIVAMIQEARSAPLPQASNDIAPRIIPHYFSWSKIYGNPFFFWIGYRPVLAVVDPEHIRDILSNKFGHFKKPTGRPETKDLFGDGLATLEGEKWAQHRRIVSPAFFMEKLKAMTPTILACATSMLERWQSQTDGDDGTSCKEIDAFEEFRALTADIIAHTAFGSSFAEGKLVFERQREQQILIEKLGRSIYIPGFRFLPTANNRYRWRLNNEIQKSLRDIIQSRGGDIDGNDLLGIMMAANRKELRGSQKNLSMGMQEIIDECKTFFFAGHETTSTLLTWTVMLLAIHSEWQEQARAEVLSVCGTHPPDAESLNHLKIVGMVINEALRLYPPAIFLFRESVKEMKMGNLSIPKSTFLMIPTLAFHHDPELWGPDAKEFNPLRFADGVANACKNPITFLPFSMGPRNCVGQNFALMEARIVLTVILQRFRFSLSQATSMLQRLFSPCNLSMGCKSFWRGLVEH